MLPLPSQTTIVIDETIRDPQGLPVSTAIIHACRSARRTVPDGSGRDQFGSARGLYRLTVADGFACEYGREFRSHATLRIFNSRGECQRNCQQDL